MWTALHTLWVVNSDAYVVQEKVPRDWGTCVYSTSNLCQLLSKLCWQCNIGTCSDFQQSFFQDPVHTLYWVNLDFGATAYTPIPVNIFSHVECSILNRKKVDAILEYFSERLVSPWQFWSTSIFIIRCMFFVFLSLLLLSWNRGGRKCWVCA